MIIYKGALSDQEVRVRVRVRVWVRVRVRVCVKVRWWVHVSDKAQGTGISKRDTRTHSHTQR